MADSHSSAAVSAGKVCLRGSGTNRHRARFHCFSWHDHFWQHGSQQRCLARLRVNSYSEIDSSILFTHVNVGRHCRIRRAIIDRDVHIPEGTTIGYDPEADRQRYFVTESGITVVTRDYSLFENPVSVDYFTSE